MRPPRPDTHTDTTASGTGTGLLVAVGACVLVALVSLLWHATPGFDPWMWSLWGRDLARLELDTSMVVAWKPLPVLTIAPLVGLGAPAPEAWLVVARTGGLLAVVAAYRLATRLAGRAAGVVAAAALLLSPAVDGRFLRLVAQGSVEPLVAALCLLAVESHLARRPRAVVLLLAGAALARPEAWALLVLYGLWQWRRAPALRPWLAATVVLVPAVWLGGDWLGSGDPLTGATRAQVLDGGEDRLRLALTAAAGTVMLPVWIAAAVATVTALRRRDPTLPVLAAGALGWVAAVAAMAVLLGYAALGRFLLPAAAAVCVVAAVGAVRIVALVGTGRVRRTLAAVALLAAAVPFAVPVARTALGDDGLALTTRRAALAEDLDAMIDEIGGREAVLACRALGVDTGPEFGVLWPATAYKLDVSLRAVQRPLRTERGVVLLLGDGAAAQRLAAEGSGATPLARTAHWAAFAVGCPGPSAGDRTAADAG